MWFEILPGAVIITTLLSVPIYAMYGLDKLMIGNVSPTLAFWPSSPKFLYNRSCLCTNRNLLNII